MKASTTLVASCDLTSFILGRKFVFRYYQKTSAKADMPKDIYHLYGDGGQKPPKGKGPQPWFHAYMVAAPAEKCLYEGGQKIIEEGYYEVMQSSTRGVHVYKYLDRLYMVTQAKLGTTWYSTMADVFDYKYRKAMIVENTDDSIMHRQLVSSGYGYWLSDALCMTVAESRIGTSAAQNITDRGGVRILDKTYWRSDFRRFKFHYGEWEIYQFAMETYGLMGIASVPGRFSAGLGRAYVSAVEDIPQLSCNNIANLLEVGGILMSFARTFKSGGILKMIADNLKSAKKPAQLWLKYRYQFCTTKMDLSEMINFSERVDELATSLQDISCKGTYLDKDKTLYKCSILYSPAQLIEAMPSSRRYGFELNAVNAWDMIPYSFVVDWFAHIGNALQILQSYSNSFDYKPIQVWYSVLTTYKSEVVYMRLPGSGNCPTPTTVSRTANGKTLFMRVADTLSLFF